MMLVMWKQYMGMDPKNGWKKKYRARTELISYNDLSSKVRGGELWRNELTLIQYTVSKLRWRYVYSGQGRT